MSSIISNRKPSSFRKFPWKSIFKKNEAEVIALNIIYILSRTGDEFRPLTWEEYVEERQKDGGFSMIEKDYFDLVISHCSSAEEAELVSEKWADRINE